MTAARFRDATAADVPALTALNDPAVPAVNVIADEVWHRFVAGEALVRVVDGPGGGLDAMLVALQPGRRYGSLNYAWYQRKMPLFTYVDRIVVAPARRGGGLGRAAYVDLVARAPDDRPIVCEVNLDPPNDASLAFHGSMGFREIAVFDPEPGKRVAMLARRPDGATDPSWPGPDDGCTLELARSETAGDVASCAGALQAELGGAAAPADLILREAIAAGDIVALIARDGDGRAVGTVVLAGSASSAAGGAIGEIQALYVAPLLRSRRLGSRLVAAARRVAKSRGWRGLEAGAPSGALRPRGDAFFRANGFGAIGTRLHYAVS
ncbi:MAG: GNAT family N-acetyltransferase [Alphaproteobacteria bacterium]|nr:GNAT family N-acetyltransferase [Alphaproteobacteria bacterium]